MNTNKIPLVVLVGRPNAGKSTLVNSLLNQKVAITSPKPQTTRVNRVFLYQSSLGQFYLSDTPGVLHKVVDAISKNVNKQPNKILNSADLVLYLVDISRPWGEEEAKSLAMVRQSNCKKVLVYNKIDQALASKNYLASYNFLEDEFDANISISAQKLTHLKSLLNLIFKLLPSSAQKITSTIQSPLLQLNSFDFIADLIREKAMLSLRKEVPYTVNVVVDSLDSDSRPDLIKIYATIETTSPRYKKMIIGFGGRMIKKIGIMARRELELISQKHVFIKLNVIVNKHWQENYL